MFDSILSLISTWGATPEFDSQHDDVSAGNATGTANAGSTMDIVKGAAALAAAGGLLKFGGSIGEALGNQAVNTVSSCCSGK